MRILFLVLVLSSCSAAFDESEARKEILKLHELQRTLHVEERAAEFAALIDGIVSVNRGLVTQATHEENVDRMTNYFNTVDFVKWDDINPPVIRFSDDGSLAYTIVEKEVIVKYMNEHKEMLLDTTIFAWTAIYRKQDDNWQIENITSTNQ